MSGHYWHHHPSGSARPNCDCTEIQPNLLHSVGLPAKVTPVFVMWWYIYLYGRCRVLLVCDWSVPGCARPDSLRANTVTSVFVVWWYIYLYRRQGIAGVWLVSARPDSLRANTVTSVFVVWWYIYHYRRQSIAGMWLVNADTTTCFCSQARFFVCQHNSL